MRTCTKCKEFKLLLDFNYADKQSSYRLRGDCKQCEYLVVKRKMNGPRRRELLDRQKQISTKWKYGLSEEEFIEACEKQDGKESFRD